MKVSPRSLVSPTMTVGIILAAVLAIAIILLAPNITITNAQQQPLISQPSTAVSQNGTRVFESTEDNFRLLVPQGWTIYDVNNTGSIFSEESRQGYGILAQLCPEEQQQQQRAASPNARSSNTSDTLSNCDQSENDIIHIVRYPDLENGLQVGNNITTANNINMTIDNILSYHMQKLQEVGYKGMQIVNSTDTTLNVTDPQTNQTITIVPAKFVEMTYSTVSVPNEIREGYFILAATNATAPNPGMTKGYSIFYEGTTTAAGTGTTATIQQTTTAAHVSLAPIIRPVPAAVHEIFDSFELIAAPEVIAQYMLAAQSEQAQQEVVAEEEEPTNPLTVEITSRDTEGEAIAPATFEFEADITGGVEPYTISWDFDDDTSSEESDEQTVSHTFEEAGSYDVDLTVTDSRGQSASDSIEITVEEEEEEEAPPAEEPTATEELEEEAPSPQPTIIEPPIEEDEQPITTEQPLTVDITLTDTEGGNTAPATFEFEADVADGTEPYTYSWDFGDGRTSNEQTVSHTFEEAGSYDVDLTVTDSRGQSASDSIEITVEETLAEEPVATEEEEPSPPSTIREPAEQGEDTISDGNLPPQQQEQQPDAVPSTGATEEIPAEQLTAQGNNQGGEQEEGTTTRLPTVTQSIQQSTSQSMQVGIPNSGSSSEERNDDGDGDENVDHIFEEAGSNNIGRTVTDSGEQRASNSIENKVEAPPEEPLEEEPLIQEIPAEQLTAREVKPDLLDPDINLGSEDLIDVNDLFDVDKFIDDLFDELGLNN